MTLEKLKQQLATTSDYHQRKRLKALIEQAKKIKPQSNQLPLI